MQFVKYFGDVLSIMIRKVTLLVLSFLASYRVWTWCRPDNCFVSFEHFSKSDLTIT